jgi:hypothetical protein
VRYIELHHVGQPRKHVASELERLATHFEFKTGCSLYLPYDRPSPDLVQAVSEAVQRLGENVVANLLSKAADI